MITILVVEDQQDYRKYLIALLGEEADFEVVGETADGARAVELAERHKPDVVLMDLGLPGLDGIKATAAIRTRIPSAGVLVLTVFDEDQRVFQAIKAGARGYLLKGSLHELSRAVREVALGNSIMHPSIARKVLEEFQRLEGRPRPDASGPLLSAREREVLNWLARGKQAPAVARLLGISPETVKTYVKRIYEKLEVSSRPEAIVEGLKRGLIGEEP